MVAFFASPFGGDGGDLNENGNFRNWETTLSWLQNFAWGDLNGNDHFKTKQYSFDLLGSKE